jgi:hypothetical protein
MARTSFYGLCRPGARTRSCLLGSPGDVDRVGAAGRLGPSSTAPIVLAMDESAAAQHLGSADSLTSELPHAGALPHCRVGPHQRRLEDRAATAAARPTADDG